MWRRSLLYLVTVALAAGVAQAQVPPAETKPAPQSPPTVASPSTPPPAPPPATPQPATPATAAPLSPPAVADPAPKVDATSQPASGEASPAVVAPPIASTPAVPKPKPPKAKAKPKPDAVDLAEDELEDAQAPSGKPPSFRCFVRDVMAFYDRTHVRCYNKARGKIMFFAVDTGQPIAATVLSKALNGIQLGKPVTITFAPASDLNPSNCDRSNCRRLIDIKN